MADITIPGENEASGSELTVHPTASRLAALQQTARYVQERVAGTPVEEAARRAGTSQKAIRAIARRTRGGRLDAAHLNSARF